ncbi:MAG TPA: orotidine-5'-phosphate decarboxylase [Pyrinomonadaceae bacterium]|nr:orotidine-5'-phosphate decarboxylase [Pyrinomonadaceae bacterium]
MTNSTAARTPEIPAHERLIVALDVEDAGSAWSIVRELRGRVGAFKIGLQLFTSAGPSLVRELCEAGERVFLDLKFHDIPNTVAKASVEVARLGVWMFNVHASGGAEMMSRAAAEVSDFCERSSTSRPRIIAVTVLTSSTEETLRETGIQRSTVDQVLDLAKLAEKCDLDGVVASPREAHGIRTQAAREDFLIVTPGVRPNSATFDDQKRVMTPREALAAGSDYLVIGRPVTAAADRSAAVEAIISEISQI